MFRNIFLTILFLLPFQFALSPLEGIDLAVVRIIIPVIFSYFFIVHFNFIKEFILKNKLLHLFVVFFILIIFSTLFSKNITWSIKKILFISSIFPIYIITSYFADNKKNSSAILKNLIYGGFILSLIGITQFISQFIFGIENVYFFMEKNITPFFLGKSFSQAVSSYPSWLVNSSGTTYMRAFAIFPDPHMFSFYIELLLPFSILFLASSKNKIKWILIVLSFLVSIALSFTRGSYVAIILSSILTSFFVPKKIALKVLSIAFIFLILLFISPHNPVSQRFSSAIDSNEGSNVERIGNWKQAIEIIKKHPLGVGIGSYSLNINENASYRTPIYAHNLYLDIAAEIGIQGLFIFILILLVTFLNFYALSKDDIFWTAGTSSILIFIIHSIVENPMFSVHILPLILILFSISNAKQK